MQDHNWVDCYVCGKAAYVDDDLVSYLGKVYHKECSPSSDWKEEAGAVTPAQLREIVDNPMLWLENEMKKRKLNSSHKYFVTFTKKTDVSTERWKDRLKFELSRVYVMSFKMCIEHENSNIHAHVLMQSNKYLRKNKEFRTYEKSYGFVDLKKVTYDNGLTEYLEKDGVLIDKLEMI